MRIINYLIPAIYPISLYLSAIILYKFDYSDYKIIFIPLLLGILNIIYAIYCYKKDEISILRNATLIIKTLLIPVYVMLIIGMKIYFSLCFNSDIEIVNVIGEIVIFIVIIFCCVITFVGSIYGILYIVYKKRHGYEEGYVWIFHILGFLIIILDFFLALYLAIKEKYVI